MGITWWQFWELNPHKIKIIAMGYREQKIEFDAMVHAWMGTYGLSAVSVAVEHCLAGKKATSKYIEKPIFSQMEETSEITKEDKKSQLEKFVMSLKIMESNFKAEHSNKGSSVS